MKLRSVDFDTVAPLMPFDKTASQVAGKGEHFEYSPPQDVVRSETPIETRRATPREKLDPGYVDLTGVKVGRLSVIGIAAASSQEKRRWVVRCQCGDYEIRRSKVIRRWMEGENVGGAMCHECGYTQKLLRGEHNEKKAAAAAEAIQSMNR